ALSAAAARIRTVQSRSSVPRGPMPRADCTIASLSSSAGNSGWAGNGFSHILQIRSPSRPLTTAEWLFKCPRLSLFLRSNSQGAHVRYDYRTAGQEAGRNFDDGFDPPPRGRGRGRLPARLRSGAHAEDDGGGGTGRLP